jgi:hypothetical protein
MSSSRHSGAQYHAPAGAAAAIDLATFHDNLGSIAAANPSLITSAIAAAITSLLAQQHQQPQPQHR